MILARVCLTARLLLRQVLAVCLSWYILLALPNTRAASLHLCHPWYSLDRSLGIGTHVGTHTGRMEQSILRWPSCVVLCCVRQAAVNTSLCGREGPLSLFLHGSPRWRNEGVRRGEGEPKTESHNDINPPPQTPRVTKHFTWSSVELCIPKQS